MSLAGAHEKSALATVAAIGQPSTLRRALSFLIALVAETAGLGLVYAGGARLLLDFGTFGRPGFDVGAILLVVAGNLLIAVSVATLVISTLGLAVLGAVKVALSISAILIPVGLGAHELNPASWIMMLYQSFSGPAGTQAMSAVYLGFTLVYGTITLVSAVAIGGRRRAIGGVSQPGRIIGLAIAVVCSIPGLILIWAGAQNVYFAQMAQFSDDIPVTGFLLMLAGVVLIGAVVAAARWSSGGLYALGLFWLLVAVTLSIFVASDPRAVEAFLPGWVSGAGLNWTVSGLTVTIGVLVLAIAIAARIVSAPGRTAPHAVIDGGR